MFQSSLKWKKKYYRFWWPWIEDFRENNSVDIGWSFETLCWLFPFSAREGRGCQWTFISWWPRSYPKNQLKEVSFKFQTLHAMSRQHELQLISLILFYQEGGKSFQRYLILISRILSDHTALNPFIRKLMYIIHSDTYFRKLLFSLAMIYGYFRKLNFII